MNQENNSLQWINFLHIYQPPTQSLEVVKKVTHESYELIISLLEKYPEVKLTLNISGSLIELLTKIDRTDILDALKKYAKEGRVELVGSALYHPILPLIPEAEIKRQIELNEAILIKTFGTSYQKRGFYLPEMAYSDAVAKTIKELGFSWIILDEIHAYGIENIDPQIHYKLTNGLSVVFRNRLFSRHFPPQKIIDDFAEITPPYLITATDGELYGHWHKDDTGYYEKAFTSPAITMITVSEYLTTLHQSKTITLHPTHWEATESHITEKNFLHLWNALNNKIHHTLWQFLTLAISLIQTYPNDPNYQYARDHLDKGLASCTWWWASHQEKGYLVTWNPDSIEIGLKEIIKSIRSLQQIPAHIHIDAEKAYTELLFEIWNYHWTHYEHKQ